MPIKCKCANCGKTIYKSPSHAQRPHQFCNKDCFFKWLSQHHRKRQIVYCDNCGTQLEVKPYRIKRNKHHFCDRKCRALWLSEHRKGKSHHCWNKVERTCEICGKKFLAWPSRVAQGLARFCSRKCFGKWKSQTTTGKNNHNWKGGNYETYYGPNWRQQRRNARRRDNYTCRRCGVTENELGRQLDVHHIIPFREFGIQRYKEANKVSNLISLCHPCHKTAEYNSP